MPISKTPLKPGGISGLGYLNLNNLQKPKSIIPGAAIFKY